jgi:hypothetical protein
MNYLESSITKDFTVEHAKQTLIDICENINTIQNDPNSDLNKRKLDAIQRYLYNAIHQIDEALVLFKK